MRSGNSRPCAAHPARRCLAGTNRRGSRDRDPQCDCAVKRRAPLAEPTGTPLAEPASAALASRLAAVVYCGRRFVAAVHIGARVVSGPRTQPRTAPLVGAWLRVPPVAFLEEDAVFYFSKLLQVLGLFVLLDGLYVGVRFDDMQTELLLLMAGIVLFFMGYRLDPGRSR